RTGEYLFDKKMKVNQYMGCTDGIELFGMASKKAGEETGLLRVNTKTGETTYCSRYDAETIGSLNTNSMAFLDGWDVYYSDSVWIIMSPGEERKGFIFPKCTASESISFICGNTMCSSTYEMDDEEKYVQEFRIYDLEKRTVSQPLKSTELTDFGYIDPKGILADGSVLLTGTSDDGHETILLWRPEAVEEPIESICDLGMNNPEGFLMRALFKLREDYGIVITPDKKEDVREHASFGEIVDELSLVYTFMLYAKNDPDAIFGGEGKAKAEAATGAAVSVTADHADDVKLRPENMRNNDGAHFTFNPHVFSRYYLMEHGEERRDVFFEYVDALIAGEDRFKCSDWSDAAWCGGNLAFLFFPVGAVYAQVEYDGGEWANISYKIPKKEFLKKEKEFEEKICGILNDALEDDYNDIEKALALYEFLTEYCTYDYEMLDHNTDPEWASRQSSLRVLDEKTGICGEIAQLYQYLLLQCGVDADESVGAPYQEGADLHARDYVSIDGKGYLVDATWGLTEGWNKTPDLQYFLFTDELRDSRDGYDPESFDIGGYGLYGARAVYDFEANDDRFEQLWNGKYLAFDHDARCIFYLDKNNKDLKRFDY
ncbi:MAG: transglutaminase domain-containing protein, partial [Lachnospiraceae bacterium]|nr:transglutaminase domain-containing protein [Lachnospiraceae bacterium]